MLINSIALPVFLACFSQAYGQGCKINLDSLSGKFPPLLLQNSDFIFPSSENSEGKRILEIGSGDELELYCHGSIKYAKDTYLQYTNLPATPSLTLKCLDEAFVTDTNMQVSVQTISCNRKQEPRLIKTQETCSPVGADGRESTLEDLYTVQIGWMIHEKFLEQIRICIDEKVYGTIWTNHTVHGKHINFRDIDDSRPGFRIDNSYLKRYYTWTTSTKMQGYYSKKTQASTVLKLLGHNEINGNAVIETSSSGTNYFAKGHLSPDAGFMYNINQDATYYFMNVAPQFQSFNNGNWKALEINTRDLASSLGHDISSYTGTHGVLQYTDKYGDLVDIYLYLDGQTRYLPAPLYYWKVLYDAETDTGAAFIGLNDPHATSPPNELCTNVCSSMAWVDWSITELDAGYMYCCSIEDARKAIPSMPDIKTTGLIQKGSEGSSTTNNNVYTYTNGPCTCTCQLGDSQCGGCTCSCDASGK